MELFASIRRSLSKKILKRKARKIRRGRGFVNINTAKKIGILWDIVNHEDITAINAFIQKMKARGITTEVLSFFSEKVLPDSLTALRFMTCVKREDLNWLYRPEKEGVRQFINNDFDIVIEICFRDLLPLRYVSALSLAKLKVGSAVSLTDGWDHTDMLIDTAEKKSVEEYLNQVTHYLEMINREAPDNEFKE